MVRPSRLGSIWLALPVLLALPALLAAQTTQDLASLVARMDKIERENSALSEEVRNLRAELETLRSGPVAAAGATAVPAESKTPAAAANTPSLEDRVDIQGQRIEEQAQTKVEASQRFPIRLTGMALFNTFMDSKQNGGVDYPTVAASPGSGRSGATLRQTLLGLEYRGPQTFLGGYVHGSIFMDFYQGAAPLDEWIRLRTGSIQVDWKTRSIMVGVDKPIFNPREPTSLAQVGVSPLTGTGNLWLWLPQVRLEQDLAFSPSTGLRARAGVIATHEVNPYSAVTSTVKVEPTRPGLEGRLEFYHKLDDIRKLEVSVGFHTSTTHAAGVPVPSQLVSSDWFFNPWKPVEFSGAFFSGKNAASLGTGTINQGYYVVGRYAEPINTLGGWGQFTIHATRRVDIHLFAGEQDYEDQQLRTGSVGKNLLFGSNLFFRVAPNVLLGPEVSQIRTFYLGQGTRINNHYDLAFAYLF